MDLEKIKKELKRCHFIYKNNILPVHEKEHAFLFGFTEEGISLFPLSRDNTIEEWALLPWQDVITFRVKKHLFSEDMMEIVTYKMTITMRIQRSSRENGWVKENYKQLERLNYYQNMVFSFGKENKSQGESENEKSATDSRKRQNTTEIVEKIYQKLKAHTSEKLVAFSLEEESAGIFDCKIGGAYYVPTGEPRPMNIHTGENMYLLAQINFAQVPHLEGFPEKGLMQILISNEDMFGCDFEDGYNQVGWKICYYEELPEHAEKDCIYQPEWNKDIELPLQKDVTYKLKAYEAIQTISFDDDGFWPAARECLPQELYASLEEDDVLDGLCDLFETYPCQIGGYPSFTQDDPRNGHSQEILLFQLESTKDIMWGDFGIGNFFITKEALRNKDFSHVMYHWDCY